MSLTLSLLLAAAAASGPNSTPASRPNVVFILADDLGWADVACPQTTLGHPSDFYETPNVARLASEGMAFTTAYACPNCAPTRAAIISGQYSTRTRVYNVANLNRGTGRPPLVGPAQHEDVAAALTTMAEMFHQAGYITAHVGKYHVGGHEGGTATLPLAQGFDFNYGGSAAGNAAQYFARRAPNGEWRFNPTVDSSMDPFAAPYDTDYRQRYRSWVEPAYRLPATLDGTPKHVGDAVTDAALQFLERHRHSAQPFFLEFNEYLVHSPLQGRPDLVAKYRAKQSLRPSKVGQDKSAAYAAMVEQFDQQVGRLLAYLQDPDGTGSPTSELARNTLVVFFSDNGGEEHATTNFPLRGAKGMFTEGGIREPLVAWMPGVVPPGTVNPTPAIMVDFYPTFIDVARGRAPDPKVQPLDGVSLWPLLHGEAASLPDRPLFWHFPGYLDHRATPCSMIIEPVAGDRYKLIYFYATQIWRLYDLTQDLGERSDLLADPATRASHRGVAAALSTHLRRWLDSTGAIYPTIRATGQTVPPPDPLQE